METALYFPYIQVPRSTWFTQILLYWDRAATIVPREMREDPDALDPYSRELVDTRLLRLLHPDEELWQLDSETFMAAFLELLDGGQAPSQPATRSRIHIGKMSVQLFSELERRDLATYDVGPEWGMWYQIETSTANLYMAYLAAVMSGKMSNTLPVTNHTDAMATLAGADRSVEQRLAELRYAVIMEALPCPSGPITPAELMNFKEQNSDKLRRCRLHLDGVLADIAGDSDQALQSIRLRSAMGAIEDEVATLREQMNHRRWPRVTLLGVGAVVGAALTTAAVVATGGTALAVGLGVGAGVAQMGVAGYTAADLIRSPRFNSRSPLAYAALAGRL